MSKVTKYTDITSKTIERKNKKRSFKSFVKNLWKNYTKGAIDYSNSSHSIKTNKRKYSISSNSFYESFNYNKNNYIHENINLQRLQNLNKDDLGRKRYLVEQLSSISVQSINKLGLDKEYIMQKFLKNHSNIYSELNTFSISNKINNNEINELFYFKNYQNIIPSFDQKKDVKQALQEILQHESIQLVSKNQIRRKLINDLIEILKKLFLETDKSYNERDKIEEGILFKNIKDYDGDATTSKRIETNKTRNLSQISYTCSETSDQTKESEEINYEDFIKFLKYSKNFDKLSITNSWRKSLGKSVNELFCLNIKQDKFMKFDESSDQLEKHEIKISNHFINYEELLNVNNYHSNNRKFSIEKHAASIISEPEFESALPISSSFQPHEITLDNQILIIQPYKGNIIKEVNKNVSATDAPSIRTNKTKLNKSSFNNKLIENPTKKFELMSETGFYHHITDLKDSETKNVEMALKVTEYSPKVKEESLVISNPPELMQSNTKILEEPLRIILKSIIFVPPVSRHPYQNFFIEEITQHLLPTVKVNSSSVIEPSAHNHMIIVSSECSPASLTISLVCCIRPKEIIHIFSQARQKFETSQNDRNLFSFRHSSRTLPPLTHFSTLVRTDPNSIRLLSSTSNNQLLSSCKSGASINKQSPKQKVHEEKTSELKIDVISFYDQTEERFVKDSSIFNEKEKRENKNQDSREPNRHKRAYMILEKPKKHIRKSSQVISEIFTKNSIQEIPREETSRISISIDEMNNYSSKSIEIYKKSSEESSKWNKIKAKYQGYKKVFAERKKHKNVQKRKSNNKISSERISKIFHKPIFEHLLFKIF
ncbi:MATH and LRR domain-containing protein PFE0570w-like [Centruroides sculpturatus]|uniref:MATH and LRR domain-containing protein PFE0570w-like n=1 Tax=Centruroides sculpturatus TaxID=218467 RepID=UPI000C6D2B66|nr:MATH and LRR domain-containing protein PFE0570w-like [Centruroides sculpturatus]